jgi:hypothetical protein
MEATRTAVTRIDGMWDAEARWMMHTGYRLILRWWEYLEFEDVLRIDRASIVTAATDPSRFAGSWRIAFGTGRLPKTIVPFGLVSTTHRYITECDAENGTEAPPDSLVFAEVFGEAVTRASVCDAVRRALTLIRLSWMIKIDDEGHFV